MAGEDASKLERRVLDAAEAALSERELVSAIDVLTGIGWLSMSHVDRWRQGRVKSLEELAQVGPRKVAAALATLHRWATDNRLIPSETDYVARTPDRRQLQFSIDGAPDVEQAYRTHWVSPRLSEAKRRNLTEKQGRPPDLVVISPLNDWTCTACSGTGSLLIMDEPGPLCLQVRRPRSPGLPAVGRYGADPQVAEGEPALCCRGPLQPLPQALRAPRRARRGGGTRRCGGGLPRREEIRRRRRERADASRAAQDDSFHSAFAAEISRLFPGCPPERAAAVARHAGTRHSGRIGRTAAGRALDERAITLAVVASVRHLDTDYDDLLMNGMDRVNARAHVSGDVDGLLERWRHPVAAHPDAQLPGSAS